MAAASDRAPTQADAIHDVLEQLAASLPGGGVTSSTDGRGTTWAVGGQPFASQADGAIELRLDAAVAAAALRTPDTASSERGAGWVRYAPGTLEGHDLDRLAAWFALAHRRASGPPAAAPAGRAAPT